MHDLNANGSIEETELIKLNEKIAMLHYGKGADKAAVREKFSTMFRENLDKDGRPVEFPVFRRYTLKMLSQLDPTLPAQEMILEQFIAEAASARAAFHCPSFASATDAEYLAHLAGEKPQGFGSMMSIAESTMEASPASNAPSREAPGSVTASLSASASSSQPTLQQQQPQPRTSSSASVASSSASASASAPASGLLGLSMADRIAADAARAAVPSRGKSEQPREPGGSFDFSPPEPRAASSASAPGPASGQASGLGSASASAAGLASSGPSEAAAPSLGRAERHPSLSTEDPRSAAATPAAKAERHPSVSTEDPGGRVARGDSKASELSIAAPHDPERREAERRVTGGFAAKDPVQVWSNSKKEWMDGVVLEAFPVKCEAEGYSVPAGTLKVSSAAGVKWIRPGQAASALRQRPGSEAAQAASH